MPNNNLQGKYSTGLLFTAKMRLLITKPNHLQNFKRVLGLKLQAKGLLNNLTFSIGFQMLKT